MANIRRKLEKNPIDPEYIFTEIGVGYRMVEDD
jgi:two-component system KDP operon response regulator KdpE